jgi:two-component system, NarL family, response regulator LiaR
VTEPIEVMVVDDHRMFADGLDIILSEEPDILVTGVFERGEDGVERCREACPDVVLMDIDLPGMDGIEATRRIRDLCPEARVIAITALQEPRVMVQAIQAGACGFLQKVRAADEVTKVIRLAAAGEMVLPSRQFAEVFSDLQWAWENAKEIRPGAELTENEIAILQAFADGKSTAQVAALFSVSISSVNGYVRGITAKLGVHSRLQAVMMAIRQRLVRASGDPSQSHPS